MPFSHDFLLALINQLKKKSFSHAQMTHDTFRNWVPDEIYIQKQVAYKTDQ
jgi:hypothetical protein